MKIVTIFAALLLIVVLGGIGYLAFADIPVAQTEVTKEIPHDRVFKTP